MTSIAEPVYAESHERDAAQRIWNVVRLHYTNRWTMLILPWLVLALIFVINLLVWLIIDLATGSNTYTSSGEWSGGTSYIFIYTFVLSIQAIALTFPFALGFSVTRRDYYLGTSSAFILLALMFSIGFVILGYLEEWTRGWWLGAHLFHVVYFGSGPVWQRFFNVFGIFLFCFFVGTVIATIYQRWKMNGVLVFCAGLAFLSVGAFAWVALTDSWAAVGQWFASSGSTGVIAWLLVPTALAALGGFRILRHATPRG
jgi:hypothetical protein